MTGSWAKLCMEKLHAGSAANEKIKTQLLPELLDGGRR
jgi:hypothetical protein